MVDCEVLVRMMRFEIVREVDRDGSGRSFLGDGDGAGMRIFVLRMALVGWLVGRSRLAGAGAGRLRRTRGRDGLVLHKQSFLA